VDSSSKLLHGSKPPERQALVKAKIRSKSGLSLTSTDFLVWGLIRRHYMETGGDMIAKTADIRLFVAVSRSTIFRSLARLQKAGIILVKARYVPCDDTFYVSRSRGWEHFTKKQTASRYSLTVIGLMFTAYRVKGGLKRVVRAKGPEPIYQRGPASADDMADVDPVTAEFLRTWYARNVSGAV